MNISRADHIRAEMGLGAVPDHLISSQLQGLELAACLAPGAIVRHLCFVLSSTAGLGPDPQSQNHTYCHAKVVWQEA